MIKILIEKLEFGAIIGTLDFERKREQRVRVWAKLAAEEFIDYAQVCEYIKAEFREKKFRLVEDALRYFAQEFHSKFRSMDYFYMKILKPKILQDASVGAEIEIKF